MPTSCASTLSPDGLRGPHDPQASGELGQNGCLRVGIRRGYGDGDLVLRGMRTPPNRSGSGGMTMTSSLSCPTVRTSQNHGPGRSPLYKYQRSTGRKRGTTMFLSQATSWHRHDRGSQWTIQRRKKIVLAQFCRLLQRSRAPAKPRSRGGCILCLRQSRKILQVSLSSISEVQL